MQFAREGYDALIAPDTIRVTVVQNREATADRADLSVMIKGSSLVTGNAALTKAREVSQLVKELTTYGLTQRDIRMDSVTGKTSSGLLGKHSSANYQLTVRCEDLGSLADLLGIITSQPNTILTGIRWGYASDSDIENNSGRDEWLDVCIRRANQKAVLIARRLGVRLLGIYEFTERYVPMMGGRSFGESYMSDSECLSQATAYKMRSDLDLEVSHSQSIQYCIDVKYRISGFTEGVDATMQESIGP